MANISYPNGAGQNLGDIIATCKPLQASGSIWYVSSLIGSDAASPRGKNAERPLATLKQAIVNASNYDIVILMDGHTETSSADADWNVTKVLHIVGAGSSAGLPTVQLTCGVGGSGCVLQLNGDGSSLRNVMIMPRASTLATVRVSLAHEATMMSGCYVKCGATDTGPGVGIGDVNHVRIENSTFISTATVATAQPESAIKFTGSTGSNNCRLRGVTVSGGTVGFSNFYAVDLSVAAVNNLEIEEMSLLLGADMKLHASTTGYVNIKLATGGSRLDW